MMDKEILVVPYVNWNGKYSIRKISPETIDFQPDNQYHGADYIISGVDLDKQEFREFNIKGLLSGIIHHTMVSTGVTSTPERIEGVISKIYKDVVQKENK